MTSRRSFLQSLSTSAVGATWAQPRPAPVVQATRTVFFSHPAGERNLVRFVIDGTDAPAGRLRIYDARRRLLGTAGVLNSGGALVGELWVTTGEDSRVTSELETPGTRTPIRTNHVLATPKRWTLHWMTVVDPFELLQTLESLDRWRLALTIRALQESRVMGNPYQPQRSSPERADHIAYLRSGMGARVLHARFGLPPSPVAVADASALRMNSAALALEGAGISYALLLNDQPGTFYDYNSRDGSVVVAASPPYGSTPAALHFADGGEAMSRAVEGWLAAPEMQSPAYAAEAAVVVSDTLESDRLRLVAAVQDWNRKFAFPEIVVGDPANFFRHGRTAISTRPMFGIDHPKPFQPEPTLQELQTAKRERHNDLETRVSSVVAPINHLLGARGPGLSGFGAAAEFPFDGHVVFNPSPLTRSDVLQAPDGVTRLVTDVPGLGYAYLPTAAPSPSMGYLEPDDTAIAGQRITARVDPLTGAIASLYDRRAGREWCDLRRGGMNHVSRSRVTHLTRWRMPGIGVRLNVTRETEWGSIETALTLYDDLPWLDIRNDARGQRYTPVRYSFAFPFPMESIKWETPAGFEAQEALSNTFAHLRWVAMTSPDGWQALLRGLDDPYLTVQTEEPTGPFALISVTPGGQSRYRFDTASPLASDDEPWRFGWNSEPFMAQSVRRGSNPRLPSYARLLTVDTGVLVAGLKQADDGFGIIVYLQEVMGLTRTIDVRPGLIRFEHASVVNFLERDVERVPVDRQGLSVSIKPYGITAVRLAQLSLDKG